MIKKSIKPKRVVRRVVQQKEIVADTTVEQKRPEVDPARISVDDQGRLIISDPALAAAVRAPLNQRRDTQAHARTTGVNLIACGNHCGEVE
jgi:hypothetical protein